VVDQDDHGEIEDGNEEEQNDRDAGEETKALHGGKREEDDGEEATTERSEREAEKGRGGRGEEVVTCKPLQWRSS
jgi:hypothetical protein